MKQTEHTYHHHEQFWLESGSALPGFQLKYTTLGNLNDDKSNVVWICHALTGSSNFTEWWPGLFSDDGPFDPNEYFIIGTNVLGGCYGSTGPLSLNPSTAGPYFHNFPSITNSDVIRSFDLLRQHLGLAKIHTLIGGSLGGQQVLTWAVQQPYLFDHLIPIACNAVHSPWGIAINEAQRLAIAADPTWQSNDKDAGRNGLIAARAMSMITFRTPGAYRSQLENESGKLDDFKVSSYQRYQGEKLANRFNSFSYWTLTKMMDSHDISRGLRDIKNALQQIQAKTLVIGIDSDLLFPLAEQQVLAAHISNSELAVIQSDYGHDAFLIEIDQLKSVIEKFLLKNSKLILQ